MGKALTGELSCPVTGHLYIYIQVYLHLCNSKSLFYIAKHLFMCI